MFLLFYLLRNFRWMFLLALCTSVVSGLSNAALVALINQALGADGEQLASLGWKFLAMSVIVLLTRTLSSTLFMRMGQSAKAMLRMRTIDRIARASYLHLERQGAARALGVLTQDLDAIVVFFVNLPNLAMHGAVIIGCLTYLGILSWQILLFALATVLVGALGFRLAHVRALFHLRGSRRREDDLVRHFHALFDGAKELKLHRARRHAFVHETLAPNVEAVRRQRTRGYVLYAAATSWGSFIFFAFIGCALFVLARFFPVGSSVMSGYAMTFLYMVLPIESVLSALPTISTARVALERIEQMNAELPLEQSQPEQPAAALESIVLEQVTHEYYREQDNEVFSLGPIDLSFSAGELVYLIGGNGSGKTTLAKLLVGLYKPESGRILLNGVEVGDAERESYRQHFAVVFNDFYLFDSLLGLGSKELDEMAQSLLQALHLEHKVKVVGGVFSTTDLSQGQRKRLALLVTYLEDRPFYVFDEWAADQDPSFKDVFYRDMLPRLKAKGKTVLVITHDDRYFHLADRYIKLEEGRIVETGRGIDLAGAGRPAGLSCIGASEPQATAPGAAPF